MKAAENSANSWNLRNIVRVWDVYAAHLHFADGWWWLQMAPLNPPQMGNLVTGFTGNMTCIDPTNDQKNKSNIGPAWRWTISGKLLLDATSYAGVVAWSHGHGSEETAHYFYVVMDLCRGGELFDMINEAGRWDFGSTYRAKHPFIGWLLKKSTSHLWPMGQWSKPCSRDLWCWWMVMIPLDSVGSYMLSYAIIDV